MGSNPIRSYSLSNAIQLVLEGNAKCVFQLYCFTSHHREHCRERRGVFGETWRNAAPAFWCTNQHPPIVIPLGPAFWCTTASTNGATWPPMVIPLGLHNCTKHHWTESAMPPLYPMSLQYSYLSSTLVHCIHSVGHILIVSVDMFHTCSRFRWSFLFKPFSSPLSPSSSSSPPSPPLSQPLTYQPPRRLQSMWRRGMKYNPHSGGHDVDADGVQGWPERVWRQLLMRLAPFFSLSQRSRCSIAKTNTKILIMLVLLFCSTRRPCWPSAASSSFINFVVFLFCCAWYSIR